MKHKRYKQIHKVFLIYRKHQMPLLERWQRYWKVKWLKLVAPYVRTLDENVSAFKRKHLIAATEFVKELPKEAQQLVNGWPGSEEWYIYRGTIPPKWIKEIVKMEDEDK